jgi:rSAM/selenodomain-associated transferase 1
MQKLSVKACLIIFARVPRIGTVKKRLAESIGEDKALYYYKILFKHAISVASGVNAVKFLYFSENNRQLPESSYIREHKDIFIRTQHGDSLGERMENAINETFSEGFERVLLIGTDVPHINTEIINKAFSALNKNNLAVGPCKDGGYYLIGIKRDTSLWKNLFKDIPWGTKDVLGLTLEKAKALNISCILLEPLFDVDTENDLKKWLKAAPDL